MSMQPVSPDQVESTRKIGARLRAEIGTRVATFTQTRAADCMGVSASTVSRTMEDLDNVCQLMAAVGLQVAPADSVVVSRDDLQALKRMAFKYLQAEIESDTGRC